MLRRWESLVVFGQGFFYRVPRMEAGQGVAILAFFSLFMAFLGSLSRLHFPDKSAIVVFKHSELVPNEKNRR